MIWPSAWPTNHADNPKHATRTITKTTDNNSNASTVGCSHLKSWNLIAYLPLKTIEHFNSPILLQICDDADSFFHIRIHVTKNFSFRYSEIWLQIESCCLPKYGTVAKYNAHESYHLQSTYDDVASYEPIPLTDWLLSSKISKWSNS